jgi:hypothetical protein
MNFVTCASIGKDTFNSNGIPKILGAANTFIFPISHVYSFY